MNREVVSAVNENVTVVETSSLLRGEFGTQPKAWKWPKMGQALFMIRASLPLSLCHLRQPNPVAPMAH